MISDRYIKAVGRICLGYFFLYFSINFSVNGAAVDIMPRWAGFLFICFALDGVAEQEKSAKLLKPLAVILAVLSTAEWVNGLLAAGGDLYWIDIIDSVINVYFQFQLLTNLADIAERQGSRHAGRLKLLRSVQTVFLTILALLPVVRNFILATNSIFAVLLAGANVIVMLCLCFVLFSYKGELKTMAGDRLKRNGDLK